MTRAGQLMLEFNNVSAGARKKASYKNTRTTGKEQYYTMPGVVDTCVKAMGECVDLTDKIILEPCGGTGEFIDGLVRAGIPASNIVSYDIEPEHDGVTHGDFLQTEVDEEVVTITNPPFGRCNSLAKKFFHQAARSSTHIGFLVPKSWRKWTVINSLPRKFHLVKDIELPRDCFYLAGDKKTKKGVLSTIFQVWERRAEDREIISIPDNGLITKIRPDKKGTVKGANTSMVTFGHSCGRVLPIQGDVHRKTTTMYLSVQRPDVLSALPHLNLARFYKNVAYVEALSIQEINYALNEYLGHPNYKFQNQIYLRK
jgi:predicted RNA methylase|tara:strand:- start:69 stop:1007 length:939 start_codon:yes stop_codon:yes gene_type:complete